MKEGRKGKRREEIKNVKKQLEDALKHWNIFLIEFPGENEDSIQHMLYIPMNFLELKKALSYQPEKAQSANKSKLTQNRKKSACKHILLKF